MKWVWNITYHQQNTKRELRLGICYSHQKSTILKCDTRPHLVYVMGVLAKFSI